MPSEKSKNSEQYSPNYRPNCPDCGQPVRAKLLVVNKGEKSYAWSHCGSYWTFKDQPTADEIMKR